MSGESPTPESELFRAGVTLVRHEVHDAVRRLIAARIARQPGICNDRPVRRVMSLAALLRFHGVDGCVRCGDDRLLQRAHVIDRFLGGLDGPQNLRPLCVLCHRLQPMFDSGDETEALEWFNRGYAAIFDLDMPLVQAFVGEIFT